MPGISTSKTSIPFSRGGSQSWESYWASLISATVETAAPTHVILTFPSAKTELTDTDFTVSGFTVSSASWTGAVLTLVLSTVVIFGDSLTVTFVTTGGTAVVTNNVAMETELATFVAGLTTPISDEEEIRLNNFMLYVKAGLGISSLSDQWDAAWIISGETQESSFRNLVKDAHHLTIVGTVTHTPFIGAQGNAFDGYLHTHYIPSSDGVNYTVADASIGMGTRSNEYGVTELDIYATGSTSTHRISLNAGSASGSHSARLNSDGLVNSAGVVFFDGLTVINRITGVNEVRIWKDGIQTNYQTNLPGNAGVAAGAPDVFVPIGAFNNNGSLENFTNKIYYFVCFGKSVEAAKQPIISNAINRYLYEASYIPLNIALYNFYNEMNDIATLLGMINTTYKDAHGISHLNVSTAADTIELGLASYANTKLNSIWSKLTYTFTIGGPNTREVTITSTLANHPELTDYYTLVAGKTGTHLGVPVAYNLLAIVSNGTYTFLCTVLSASSDANRYTACKELIDIALVVLAEGDTTGMDITADSGSVCLLSDGVELWSKASTTQYKIGSITKLTNLLVAIPEISDFNEVITVISTDVTAESTTVLAEGDTFTYEEALHLMLIESNNTTAVTMARLIGAKIYIDNT